MKILIVEDNEQARRLLEQLLRQFFPDHDLIFFSTGSLRMALQLAHTRGPFKLGLVDLELEDAKPGETVEAVPQFQCESVIAMSGVASGEARKQVRRCGATDYIEKPIIAEVFIDKVARVLGKGDDQDGAYSEIQHKAQRRLHERIAPSTAADSILASSFLTPGLRMWLKVGLGAVASLCVILSFAIGQASGAWKSAKDQGAKEQLDINRNIDIDRKFSEIAAGNTQRDRKIEGLEKILRRLEINQVKLLLKNGIQPEKENDTVE